MKSPKERTSHEKRFPWIVDILKGILFFVVLAPPIGSLFILLLFVIALIVQGGVVLSDLSGDVVLETALIFSVFSYIFGGIPAAITGAIAGSFRCKLRRAWHCYGIGVIGLVTAALL